MLTRYFRELFCVMRAVGLKVLKNKLSEYVRLAAGRERVLLMDRDRVVAERVPPEPHRGEFVHDALLAEAVRSGLIAPPAIRSPTRLHARRPGQSHGDPAREALDRLAVIESSPIVLERAVEPFPVPVRALDALHLAMLSFLAAQRQRPALATYDSRIADAATRLGFALHPL